MAGREGGREEGDRTWTGREGTETGCVGERERDWSYRFTAVSLLCR